MPNGWAWLAKRITSSNTYKFLKGISPDVLFMYTVVQKFKDESSIVTCIDTIDRWEKDYGIPDDCFFVASDLETRRNNVILKKAGLGTQTRADFQALALKLGFACVVWTDGTNKFTIYFDLPTTLNPNLFPLQFPYPFGSNYGNIIECVFAKLIPANCNAIFRYIL